MPTQSELLDQLLKDFHSPDDVLGVNGVLQHLSKALLARALEGEIIDHTETERAATLGKRALTTADSTTRKTTPGRRGQGPTARLPERSIDEEPEPGKRSQVRSDGLDNKVISLYARGMTTREIQGHLAETDGLDVSASQISAITDTVMDDVRAWQSRPLDTVYPIVYLDALQVKVRTQGRVINKAIYLAFGVTLDGLKDVLGMWAAETEGAKFWLQVVTELKNRGVQDIFIACVDGLKGFPEAIEAVFPATQVQLCLVHLVRYSLRHVSHKHRRDIALALKDIYQAATLDAGERQLDEFEVHWGQRYPLIVRSWRTNWARIAPMFGYPPEVRRAIYTTNTIESLNMTLRKIIKNRPLFPSDEAVFKLLYLALRNISKKWTMPLRDWSGAMNQFAIIFDGRIPLDGLGFGAFAPPV